MFTITVRLDPATTARIDRLLDLLETKEQVEVDQATGVLRNVTEQLKKSNARLAAAALASQ